MCPPADGVGPRWQAGPGPQAAWVNGRRRSRRRRRRGGDGRKLRQTAGRRGGNYGRGWHRWKRRKLWRTAGGRGGNYGRRHRQKRPEIMADGRRKRRKLPADRQTGRGGIYGRRCRRKMRKIRRTSGGRGGHFGRRQAEESEITADGRGKRRKLYGRR